MGEGVYLKGCISECLQYNIMLQHLCVRNLAFVNSRLIQVLCDLIFVIVAVLIIILAPPSGITKIACTNNKQCWFLLFPSGVTITSQPERTRQSELWTFPAQIHGISITAARTAHSFHHTH